MTVAEGGGKRAVSRKFQEVYVPALKANFLVWPAVQIINFRLIPMQFQIVRTLSNMYSTSTHTDLFLAFCFHHRYCVDSLPLPHQLLRRGVETSPCAFQRVPFSSTCMSA